MGFTTTRQRRFTLNHLFPHFRLTLIVCTLLALLSGHNALADDAPPVVHMPYADAIAALKDRSFDLKAQAVDALVQSGNPLALAALKALVDGDLYYTQDDERVVIAKDASGGVLMTDAESGAALGEAVKRDLKKIVINNTMRNQLRAAIARLSLASDNTDARLSAVLEILKDLTPEAVALLRTAREDEQNRRVREALDTALAIADVNADNKRARLAAIDELSASLYPEARNVLVPLAAKGADGEFVEPDAEIRKAVAGAIRIIDGKREFYSTVETVFFGLSLGSVLLLAAIGLAITFGVMGVINMAHGELIMLGAYTTYVVQLLMPHHIEWSLLVAVPAAFLVAGLVGIAIERGVIRFLYGRPLETLLATFGISLILQQTVRTIFSPLNRSVETPQWMSGSLEINSVLSLTYNRLYIVIFSLIVFFMLLAILKKTRLGLQVRAVAQNRAMARAMGVRTGWVDALTFGLGSGIAGVAGVALSQLTNVGPNLGQSYIIDSFMVVVFGGVGNLWGTLVGALSLGVVNKFLEPWAGAVLAKILVLVFIILFIQKKPRGLFPQKGRAVEH
ncbi:MAG: branched-chain amino acid transport system permease protein [Gammaproteobacteria bacterium]|nr:MAG: branched-chain amino acid transport system permease protein [Gammaproteobacteria bacterium]TND02102.1 MAG: branched-chain amino acid transport system permease protein [Gammaproteobacteria bacterium]